MKASHRKLVFVSTLGPGDELNETITEDNDLAVAFLTDRTLRLEKQVEKCLGLH